MRPEPCREADLVAFASLPSVLAEAAPVGQRFVAAGHRVFLVGGIVRDLWLDRRADAHIDLDLTTDALPEQTKNIVGPLADSMWLQGERFGTIGAQIAGRPYEITTHRAESYAAHSRKPEVTYATAIEEDLSRRDFTINAMAVELPGGELIDPFEGTVDLRAGRLRTPIDPDLSFTDDPLRMLRAARFVAGYALTPAPEVVTAMEALSARLDIVSAERIREEFDKLLATAAPSTGLELLLATGLLERVLPDVDEARLDQRREALEASDRRPALRMAILLAGGNLDEISTRLVALRCSNDRRRYTASVLAAAAAVADHPTDPPTYREWHRRAGPDREDALVVAVAVDPDAAAVVAEMEAVRGALQSELDDFSLPIGGREVIDLLGINEGPAVGEALTFLQELRVELGPLGEAVARQAVLDWWTERS
jgi:poly(A) polymerase